MKENKKRETKHNKNPKVSDLSLKHKKFACSYQLRNHLKTTKPQKFCQRWTYWNQIRLQQNTKQQQQTPAIGPFPESHINLFMATSLLEKHCL